MSQHKVKFGPLTEEVVRRVQEQQRQYWGKWVTLGEALEWVMEDIKWHPKGVPAYGRFSPNLRCILEQAVYAVQETSDELDEPLEDYRDAETAILVGGERLIGVHPMDKCLGQVCAIHNKSQHRMRSFSQHWRSDRGIIERICPHGIGHPDPDDYRIVSGADSGMHGCCGICCVGAYHNDDDCMGIRQPKGINNG